MDWEDEMAVDWQQRIEQWSDFEKGLLYRTVPLHQIDFSWNPPDVFLLIRQGQEVKSARITPDALYDLYVYCQEMMLSDVRILIPPEGFGCDRSEYHILIKHTFHALLENIKSDRWGYYYTDSKHGYAHRAENSFPQALFEKMEGRVTIVGIAPNDFTLISALPALQKIDPNKIDWSQWEGERYLTGVQKGGTVPLEEWTDEIVTSPDFTYLLLRHGNVFVRFVSGYTGKVDSGARVGIYTDSGQPVCLMFVGRFSGKKIPDWRLDLYQQGMMRAWKAFFRSGFLDTVAITGSEIGRYEYNKARWQESVKDAYKEANKRAGVNLPSLDMKTVSDTTLIDAAVGVYTMLSSGKGTLYELIAEEIVGRAVSDHMNYYWSDQCNPAFRSWRRALSAISGF